MCFPDRKNSKDSIYMSFYSPSTYDHIQEYALYIVQNKLDSWKKSEAIRSMIEHESLEAANVYIKYLLNFLSKDEIQELANLNDLYGDTTIQNILGITTSTNSIRYIRHSYDLCMYIKNKKLNDINIIEVGGGYGGMALIMSRMIKKMNINVNKYIIYDLQNVCLLQQYYLSKNNVTGWVEWHNSNSFGSDITDNNNVLFSSYALSELSKELRDEYLKNLLPKINGAFFIWNGDESSKHLLPKDRDETPEEPNTNSSFLNTWIRL